MRSRSLAVWNYGAVRSASGRRRLERRHTSAGLEPGGWGKAERAADTAAMAVGPGGGGCDVAAERKSGLTRACACVSVCECARVWMEGPLLAGAAVRVGYDRERLRCHDRRPRLDRACVEYGSSRVRAGTESALEMLPCVCVCVHACPMVLVNFKTYMAIAGS